MLFNLALLLVHRISASAVTLPPAVDLLTTGFGCLLLGLAIIPIGWWTGFLRPQVVTDRLTILRILAIALLFPALTEEVCFRVLLLPHPTEAAAPSAVALSTAMSLIAFVLYHPLNALSFYPVGRKTFWDVKFLLLAGLLGVVCSIAYLQTGSLWLAVALHWLAVVVWLLLLGGYAKLNLQAE